MAEQTEGKCLVCGGKIVEKIVKRFNPIHGSMIIGPASENQFHDVSEGHYCSSCGLKYEFIPPTEKEPLEDCDHVWRQKGWWDGRDEDGNKVDKNGNYVGGPKAGCIKCNGTSYFNWDEWNSIPAEKKKNL